MKKVYDVFLSHLPSDSVLAREIANQCRAASLEVFTTAELAAEADLSAAVWDALAECRALIVIYSPSGFSSSMWVEIGAIQAWNKPIFVIATDPSIKAPPPGLSGIPLYSPGRIDEVVQTIKQSTRPLSDQEQTLLAQLYAEVGIPVAALALRPETLSELAKRFGADIGRTISEERLLTELLRMRKQGVLTRSPGRTRPRPKSETA